MRPNLIHWNQFEILEKIVSGLPIKEILLQKRVNLIDDKTGEFLMPIEYTWEPHYAIEAFVNTIETILLSDQVDLLIPASMINDGVIMLPEHTPLTQAWNNELIMFPMPDKEMDSGAIDTGFHEFIAGGEYEDSSLMIAKAYNGQFGKVSLRVSPSDFEVFTNHFTDFSDEYGFNKNIIDQAYQKLCDSYKLKLNETFKNSSELILPPLVTTFLSRLPDKTNNPEIIKNELLKMRKELEKTRKRFSDFQAVDDDPDISIQEAEKIMNAINADSKHFLKKLDTNITDNSVVQFCIDNMSFLVKLIVKAHKIKPEEIAEKLAAISPGLEKRIRSSAPTILSKWALKTRKVKGVKTLLDKKLGLNLDAS